MPLGTPYLPEVVPTAQGGQVVNVDPTTAASSNGAANYTPARYFAESRREGRQIVDFHAGVPMYLDTLGQEALDPTTALTAVGTVPNQAATHAVAFSYTFPASAFSNDQIPITLAAALSNASPLPSWLSFSPTTGVFSGTPGTGDEGTITVTVTATTPDGAETATQSFNIVVG